MKSPGRSGSLQPVVKTPCLLALPMMADDAMKQSRLLVNNPRPVAREDALSIYSAAW